MKKSRVFLIILVSIFVFLLVYTPHYNYPFPSHIDEWHHITEAMKIEAGEYTGGGFAYRIGFQILLLLLLKITNLVLIYKFLPALWAVFSALVLFSVVYKKTNKQFYTAILAMIFFASIKSNVNITGLWFFTPLSFSIPFIFLYIYFFTEGIEKQNKKLILISLAVMIFLLFFHSISVLFAIPFLFIYSLFNFKYLKKEWKFFSAFLIIPVMGTLFYKFLAKNSWESLPINLFQALQFKYGWGVLEIDNSFFELYSLVGYLLAIMGLIFIFKNKENLKKYIAYLLWPIAVLIMIIIYKITGVSYLSPYQRNLYYFVIGLPVLSAFGLNYLFGLIKKPININYIESGEEIFKKTIFIIIFILIMFFTFLFYTDIPDNIKLYEVIDSNDYQALLFLSTLPKSTVMALSGISTAMYSISKHEPIATYFFYGNRKNVKEFFSAEDCRTKQKILDKYKAKYVLSKFKIDCGWELIYDKGDYIYEIKEN